MRVGTVKAVRQPAYSARLNATADGSRLQCRRVPTSIVRPGMGYGTDLVNLSNRQQVAVDKAWYQILGKMLLALPTASGSAILKVLGDRLPCRASKLNACFMNVLQYSAWDTNWQYSWLRSKGIGLDKTEDLYQDEREEHALD